MVLRNSDDTPIESPDEEEEATSFIDQLVASCALGDSGEDLQGAEAQDQPEPSQVELLVLQARITALDPAEDEAVLELCCDEAAEAA